MLGFSGKHDEIWWFDPNKWASNPGKHGFFLGFTIIIWFNQWTYSRYKNGFQLQVSVNVSACNAAITGCEKSRFWQKALHLFIQIDQMKLEPKPGQELIVLHHVDHRSSADIDELGPKFWSISVYIKKKVSEVAFRRVLLHIFARKLLDIYQLIIFSEMIFVEWVWIKLGYFQQFHGFGGASFGAPNFVA